MCELNFQPALCFYFLTQLWRIQGLGLSFLLLSFFASLFLPFFFCFFPYLFRKETQDKNILFVLSLFLADKKGNIKMCKLWLVRGVQYSCVLSSMHGADFYVHLPKGMTFSHSSQINYTFSAHLLISFPVLLSLITLRV